MKKFALVALVFVLALTPALAFAGCSAPVPPLAESSVADESSVATKIVETYDHVLGRLKTTAESQPYYKYGYAKYDINGDGEEELISFCNDKDYTYKDKMLVTDIHTMKDGVAEQIPLPNGTYEQCPFPSADGMFYWISDAESGGALRKYKFSAGAVKLELLEEYKRDVSSYKDNYSDDERLKNFVPTQAFFHGEQAITEDEFYAAMDKYEQEEKAGELTFEVIPIISEDERQRLFEESRTSDESEIEVPKIDAPGKYKNASVEYASTLDDLYRYAFAYDMYHKENDRTDSWYMEFLNGVWSHDRVETSKLGYREMDINKDGITELITGAYDDNDGFSLIAVWTLKDGKPVHVDGFGGRYRGVLLEGGSIYTYGNGGAMCTHFTERVLAPHATEWTEVAEYAVCDEYNYKKQNGRYIYMTFDEYYSLAWDRFNNLEKNAKLKITPIL